jgi:hypothetical protein
VTRSRNILPPRRPWTSEEIELVRELYADMKTQTLAERMGRPTCGVYRIAFTLGISKSAAYLASPEACRLRRDASPASIATRFVKGQVPPNKGVRRPGWSPGRMASTWFCKGERRGAAKENWKPIGTILADTEGYLRIKIREGIPGAATGFGNTKIWPLLQRHVWEQNNGPIPPAHAIVFKDGKRSNCAIENLECISRGELMRRNSFRTNYSPELQQVIQLRGALNRVIRRREREKQDVGSAGSPVRDARSLEG